MDWTASKIESSALQLTAFGFSLKIKILAMAHVGHSDPIGLLYNYTLTKFIMAIFYLHRYKQEHPYCFLAMQLTSDTKQQRWIDKDLPFDLYAYNTWFVGA